MIPPTSAVNPNNDAIEALRGREDDNAIVMVNLLKFRGDEGREQYARYAAVSGQEIAARDGRVLFHGTRFHDDVLNAFNGSDFWGGDFWESVALVYYPRRAAWLDMQDSAAYQAAIPDRSGGLSHRLLFAFSQQPGTPSLDDVTKTSGAVFVINLVRFETDEARAQYAEYANIARPELAAAGAETVLFLQADQALVSDDAWETFILTRYPSLEAMHGLMNNERLLEANRQYRQPSLGATIVFSAR